MRTPTLGVATLVSLAALASCGKGRAPEAAGQAKVLATVNGAPITEADLDQRTRRAPTGAPGHDASGNVLQTLVREELIAQKAVQLGLDQEPGYRERLDEMEAQLRAFKRQQLAAFYRVWVQNQAAPAEADARAWFEKNAAFVQTRFHVLQILRKGEPDEIARDHAALKAGTPFEQVAARRFPDLPASVKPPWDLGELAWSQVPQPWRGVVDHLEPGQISDVIPGENGRSWVIKLAGKRVDPAVTFETEKDRIVEVLRQEKATELYDKMLGELRAQAKIVYARDAPAAATPRD